MPDNVVWTPPPALVESARLTRLMRRLDCADYHALHRLSVEEPDAFWPAVVDDLDLRFSRPWDRVLDESDGPEWARWFVGGRLNLAESCVHRWRDLPGEAAVWCGEEGSRWALHWPGLSGGVATVGEAGRRAG